MDAHQVESIRDDQVVVITTGSQGEPLAALRRMAYGLHRQIELREGDTVVFSATPVPGNERAVNETIDHLFRIGCDVITPREAPIHTSGHGHREELKLMLNLTRPRYLMPVHGDFKRIRLHSELAEAVGIPSERIFRGENGLPLDIDERGAGFGEPVQAGMVFIDGIELGDATEAALRDRRTLSGDGLLVIVATVSAQDGGTLGEPEIILRGVPFSGDEDGLVDGLRGAIEESLDRAADEDLHEIDLIQQVLHDDLGEFVYRRLQRRPMILPIIVEV